MSAPKLQMGALNVTSPAFAHGERIPDQYADANHQVPPPLIWTNAPEGTDSFAVVMHDPDAPLTYGFTHWIVYGIPPHVTRLEDDGADYTPGVNSLDEAAYLIPMPPVGRTRHHYYLDVYALDSGAGTLQQGLNRAQLLAAIDGHIIEQARIVGTYSRSAEDS
ncbi:YbhB/YbcL family Raf kinase inhibitor-like protein [Streptomyces sp. NPDC054775]